MRKALIFLGLSIVSACGGGAPNAAPPAKPNVISGSSVRPVTPKTATSFSTPAGFTAERNESESFVVFKGPEADQQIAVVDTNVQDSDAAVKLAWFLVRREEMNRAVKTKETFPGRRGWLEYKRYEYETNPDEKLIVVAHARKSTQGYSVFLVHTPVAAFERRVGAIRGLIESLVPKGYTKETFAGKKASPLDEKRIKEIETALDRMREKAGVPGVAFTLVENGKVVKAGGLGVRELGKSEKVDADTLFMIASNTKALTTLLLAKLVDEKKLAWDTPVKTVYPAFKLGDDATTSQVLVKHLVCACTGLPRQDLEWIFEFKNQTPKGIMGLLGTFQPTTKFGEAYQYSNLLAAAGGYVAGYALDPKKELGAAYDEGLRTRVTEPLGMKGFTFDVAKALAANHASPHSESLDGKVTVSSMDINRAAMALRPSGAAWASVSDLTRYVLMELGKGTIDGKRIVSEENVLARRVPQVKVGENATYGMGLTVDNEFGVPYVHHGGALLGYKSDMFWLPDVGIGGVILTNSDAGQLLLRPFIRKTLEVVFDGNKEAEDDLAANADARKNAIAKERERYTAPADPAVLAKLAAKYKNAALGDITVAKDVFDFGEWKSPMGTRKNDDGTISLVTIAPGVIGFELVVGTKDGKRTLTIRDAQHEYVFVEV